MNARATPAAGVPPTGVIRAAPVTPQRGVSYKNHRAVGQLDVVPAVVKRLESVVFPDRGGWYTSLSRMIKVTRERQDAEDRRIIIEFADGGDRRTPHDLFGLGV